MNILPKKRWHVRTKENIARVRRDEANAAAEEKEKHRRIQQAEQEARTTFLREQAKQRLTAEDEIPNEQCTDVVPYEPNKHVNFFTELEAGVKSWGTNKEHEEEKKQEQEKYEKSIGLLTYLGQTQLDSKGDTPWYEKSHEERFKTESKNSKDEIGVKTKNFLDPLKDVQKYLEIMGKKDSVSDKPKKSFNKQTSFHTGVMHASGESCHKKHKKHKKHSKKKHKKRKRNSSDSGTNSSDSDDSESHDAKRLLIEALRTERIKREREERTKAEKLLAKMRGEKVDESSTSSLKPPPPPDGRQGYNSQFNPHLARKPRLEN